MSVIEAEVEVDETDIPFVALGQQAKVTIDAVARPHVQGPRDRDRQQPDSGEQPEHGGQRQATTFKVVITLDEEVPERPPRASPARRKSPRDEAERRSSVPIQALTVREMLFDPQGKIVREDAKDRAAAQQRGDDRRPRTTCRPGTRGKRRKASSWCATGGPSSRRSRSGRRRAVLRSARRAQGRRPGGHRSVRERARAGRRRGGPAAEERGTALGTRQRQFAQARREFVAK